MAKKYSHIIWDWNGTLYDDAEWCFNIINTMLNKRGMKELKNMTEYRDVFDFPVKNYYMKIGFDFDDESFEVLSKEFITLYRAGDEMYCSLKNNTETIFETFHKSGFTQVILSASEINNLNRQIKYLNIENYFDAVIGLMDTYAKGKVDIGLEFIKANKIDKAILIGDTVHDFEVAQKLGVDCILVSGGHQNKNKLLKCNVPVFDGLNEIINYLLTEA